jgi:hypothetical protein
MRTTKQMLSNLLKIAARRSKHTYALDHDAQGYRLYTVVGKDLYGRDLSPRLCAREMRWWLEGYVEGLEA